MKPWNRSQSALKFHLLYVEVSWVSFKEDCNKSVFQAMEWLLKLELKKSSPWPSIFQAQWSTFLPKNFFEKCV